MSYDDSRGTYSLTATGLQELRQLAELSKGHYDPTARAGDATVSNVAGGDSNWKSVGLPAHSLVLSDLDLVERQIKKSQNPVASALFDLLRQVYSNLYFKMQMIKWVVLDTEISEGPQ